MIHEFVECWTLFVLVLDHHQLYYRFLDVYVLFSFSISIPNLQHFNHLNNIDQLQDLRDLIDKRISILSSESELIDTESRSDESCLGTSSETSILISDDDLNDIEQQIFDHLFTANIILDDKERKFGKRGRKLHKVSMDIPIDLSNIKQNRNGQFHAKNITLDHFVLSTNKSLTLNVNLRKYPEISGNCRLIIPRKRKRQCILLL